MRDQPIGKSGRFILYLGRNDCLRQLFEKNLLNRSIMMYLKKLFLAACIAVLPGFASAATINLTKEMGWTDFRFADSLNGGAWLEAAPVCDPKDFMSCELEVLSFSVSLAEAAYLQVTDAFLSGDVFEVFANGASLGLTSASKTGNDIGNDYTAALADDRFSSGTWLLGPGEYIISGFVRSMPQTVGRASIRIADVPVPGSLALLLGAGAALGASGLRRRNRISRSA
ncbi:PEP-CTERM sorting domain-containing protein [Tropicimonas sp. IMCC6043]|uniref:PEP-CTERM sorting domain-containing protein n=1 Tax=Tropicimonas sp. IMCC6043 TaxID=2510645 RepID=UPI00101B730E|nr:PEP-CTERM sorting domain-containing protein [Tropicimonas sp. IMCC6043]RYH11719.1 PEP-CTERM sorting domain-containing protein [Tropicimonas sp. IMCC6043]